MTDYTALGRYIAASEAMQASLRERNLALHELKRIIERSLNTQSSYAATDFNAQEAERLLAAAGRAHHTACQHMADANAQAHAAQRPALRMI